MDQPAGEQEQGMGTKRPAEEDYNSNVHAKRSREEDEGNFKQLTLRFLLQSRDAGGIIGKAGQNVKRLRSECFDNNCPL
ncbi:PREDICTED: heterogeneous nuclear ribonucleoprotein K-like [Acropora digitifera]|uniref:heterogeneous nuclear ribonucleoprotein K-like n=1 Tax=Acropora digitifera TaxID=70779 RepID=UPI00077B2483|nr:PREDICTED: heterogeneous nuclear ribonucleoprotein K-like [Acropora digitifera]